jgi:hypothetical protein
MLRHNEILKALVNFKAAAKRRLEKFGDCLERPHEPSILRKRTSQNWLGSCGLSSQMLHEKDAASIGFVRSWLPAQ